jgi:hypothetical protein
VTKGGMVCKTPPSKKGFGANKLGVIRVDPRVPMLQLHMHRFLWKSWTATPFMPLIS